MSRKGRRKSSAASTANSIEDSERINSLTSQEYDNHPYGRGFKCYENVESSHFVLWFIFLCFTVAFCGVIIFKAEMYYAELRKLAKLHNSTKEYANITVTCIQRSNGYECRSEDRDPTDEERHKICQALLVETD